MTAISGRQDGSGLSKPLGLTLLIATVGALISLSAMFATGATASLSEQDFPGPMAGAVGNANYSPETRAKTELGKARRAKSKKYTQVAVGGAHSCGLEKSGQVRCWGSKKWLQTGDPKSGYVTKKPIKVSGLPKVRVMSAGFRHSCALSRRMIVPSAGGRTPPANLAQVRVPPPDVMSTPVARQGKAKQLL